MIFGLNLWSAAGVLIIGLIGGYLARKFLVQLKRETLERKIQEDIENAKTKAKEIIFHAREKAAGIIEQAQKEEKERKQELRDIERRILKKEDELREEKKRIDNLAKDYSRKESEIKQKEQEIAELRDKAIKQLEEKAKLTKEEAKAQLIKDLEQTYRQEIAEKMVSLEKEKKEEVERKLSEVITSAIQRYSRDHISDLTTTTVPLPNEDLKGKIIGREGRNIRTFEKLTGVEVIVDDAPDSVTLSSFDPYRREIAKLAMEKLLKDGRIQPAKIEEKVEEARSELKAEIRKAGEEAAYEVGILDLPDEIISLLGRLKFRTSYGQNVLTHSIEMAHIAGMIAAELGLNVETAKKGALLHDIGKAIDHEVEGTHVELGRKLLQKHGIEEEVIRAMESHHEDYPFATPESFIVAAADIISAARPGARRDTLEKYLKRVEDIEKAAMSFEGVQKAYAISAGREVRVFVVPEKIDDFGALQLARKIANKIQSDINYPGEIKVTVIREIKAVEVAK